MSVVLLASSFRRPDLSRSHMVTSPEVTPRWSDTDHLSEFVS